MRNFKRVLLLTFCVLSFTLSAAKAHAIEISIGASSGFERSIFRGSDANVFGNLNDLDHQSDIQFDVMVEILPFLALETGIGYSHTKITDYDVDMSFHPDFPFGGGMDIDINEGNIVFFKHGFTIPIMLRGQYEFSRVLIYGSVGPKLFIPISDYVYKVSSDFPAGFFKNSNFVLDLGFALGVEFRVGDANYLGLRANYDLNLISPLKSIGGKSEPKFYNDNVGLNFTYRYAFGSKWK